MELKHLYDAEKADFYSKVMPIILVITILISASLEVIYRFGVTDLEEADNMPFFISVVNGAAVVLMLLITCFHKCCPALHSLVAPVLTFLTFAYLSFLDYDYTLGSIYYS